MAATGTAISLKWWIGRLLSAAPLPTKPPCQSGVWSRPDTPGQYAFFNLSSCPAGWIAANGANGTVDLRGEFIRGWDNGRGVDTGRGLASWQADEFRSHNHQMYTATGGWQNGGGAWDRAEYMGWNTSTNAGGAETRPRNLALLACVKI